MPADPMRFGFCSEIEQVPHEMEKRSVGADDQYGEVTVFRCTRCGRSWLHYFMEYEYLSAAGRWLEGEISPEVAASLKPNEAVQLFDKMESTAPAAPSVVSCGASAALLRLGLHPFRAGESLLKDRSRKGGIRFQASARSARSAPQKIRRFDELPESCVGIAHP